MPASWRSLITKSSPVLPGDSRIIPFAPGADPSLFFAELYSPLWSGVVSVAAPSGAVIRIAAFKDPKIDQAYGGSFDGRWLVWIEQQSSEDSNAWEIWAWDSEANKTFIVAASPRVNGATVSGPIVEPIVSAGKAAWVQSNQQGIGEVHLYSLAARHDQVIASHATTPVVFWGANLLWMHLDVAGQSGHFEMIDASGQPVSVPEPLASVHSLAFLAVSKDVVAWTDGTSIWAYRPGQSSASLVYKLPSDFAQFIAIAGDLITWDGSGSPMALDLRSSSVTTLTPANGGRFASAQSLVIYWPNAQSKSTSGEMLVSDVDASRLPALPGCS
jgi:hypothetical protein